MACLDSVNLRLLWSIEKIINMPEIMIIKPILHFIFQNDSICAVRNLFAGIVRNLVVNCQKD
jgi:hypothetical protein